MFYCGPLVAFQNTYFIGKNKRGNLLDSPRSLGYRTWTLTWPQRNVLVSGSVGRAQRVFEIF